MTLSGLVNRDHFQPVLHVELVQRFVSNNAGVVDQNVKSPGSPFFEECPPLLSSAVLWSPILNRPSSVLNPRVRMPQEVAA
jgi:hypothetical protein